MDREADFSAAHIARVVAIRPGHPVSDAVTLEEQQACVAKHLAARPGDFVVDHGKLWFRTQEGRRLVISSEEARESLFDVAHSGAMAGHRSAHTTEMRMRLVGWWPGMSAWIASRCRACFACARAKHRTNQVPVPLRAVPAALRPFEHVHIDALEGLPLVDGMDNVWVVIDRLSHWVFLVPASSSDNARTLARRLFAAVFAAVGLPTRIGSDRDPILTSVFTQALFN